MTLRHKKLTIADGYITMWNYPNVGASTLLITKVDGWDEFPEIRRNSVPKLFGNGVYVSTAASYAEREISITCQASYPNAVSIRAIRQSIGELGILANDDMTLNMYYYSDGVETFREKLIGKPAATFLEDWEEKDNTVIFTLNFVCAEPLKTVYLNGSTTPEAGLKL